jgi:hypothetical protein
MCTRTGQQNMISGSEMRGYSGGHLVVLKRQGVTAWTMVGEYTVRDYYAGAKRRGLP